MRIQVSGISVSCAHFIEIAGTFEKLHGHNLSISAEAEGGGDDGIVMDFRELETQLKDIVSILDHRLILPGDNPGIEISHSDGYTQIMAAGKRYLMPSEDTILLPLENSTAEEIGRWVYSELVKRLPGKVSLRNVTVQEMEGKCAVIDS
jgi:6-pyruvoyltetrahydropterin/6-carboxytetrahydropterin synthase